MPYSSQSPFVAGPLSVASLEQLRTNLAETAAAKATTAGRHFIATGSGALAERSSAAALDDSIFSTTSTSYVDATTPGPSVTVTTGPNAWVHIWSFIGLNNSSNYAFYSFAVSGATTLAAGDIRAVYVATYTSGQGMAAGATFLVSLTPGSNTFTAKYKITGAVAGSFDHRRIAVFPL